VKVAFLGKIENRLEQSVACARLSEELVPCSRKYTEEYMVTRRRLALSVIAFFLGLGSIFLWKYCFTKKPSTLATPHVAPVKHPDEHFMSKFSIGVWNAREVRNGVPIEGTEPLGYLICQSTDQEVKITFEVRQKSNGLQGFSAVARPKAQGGCTKNWGQLKAGILPEAGALSSQTEEMLIKYCQCRLGE
jgi:hypothetical protein